MHRCRRWMVQSPGGANVPSHECTLAPPGNTIEFMLPSAHPSPQYFIKS